MLRACKIVDERGVRRVTGAPSGRSLFLVGASPPRLLIPPDVSCSSQTSEQAVLLLPVSVLQVMGESKRKEEYLCFPEHLCTCYSFFYDVVGRSEQLSVSTLTAATAS